MANINLGKKFEDNFKHCWKKSFPDGWIFRLNDQLSGFKEISGNPCDFLCFTNGKLFLMECKEHKSASIPFSAIPQYERLLQHKNIKDVYPGVTIWFSEKDLVIWVSVKEMEKMIADGKKSIGIKMLEENVYNIVTIPSEKKRVFMDSDYSILLNYEEK